MNDIVIVFHMFDVTQDIRVYKNNECIEELHPTLNETVKTICGLNQCYDIGKISMYGNPSFVNKYIKELKTKFSNLPTIEIRPIN